ncbi:hypothetical protein T4E_12310 [Trichinella pseudospiralis]|uniref:Uncharacterized protein n=1 Tax=Trichinella pseudospiralis TaxID=6337 RepID=A0A0V0Y5S3_TRIPS|nr:hypothetical protein T4E_12310 [Trichinella pseudospiralis]
MFNLPFSLNQLLVEALFVEALSLLLGVRQVSAFLYDEINERVQVRFIARSLPASSQIIRALDIDYQSKAKVSGVDGVVLKRQQMLYSEWSTCQSFATSAIDYRLSIIRCQLLKRSSSRNQKHSIPNHPLLSPADTASSCNALSRELSVHQLIATLKVQFSDTLTEYVPRQLVEPGATYCSGTKSKRVPAAQYMRYLSMDVIFIFSTITSKSISVKHCGKYTTGSKTDVQSERLHRNSGVKDFPVHWYLDL